MLLPVVLLGAGLLAVTADGKPTANVNLVADENAAGLNRQAAWTVQELETPMSRLSPH